MSNSPLPNRYPRGFRPGLMDAHRHFEDIVSANICVEETVAMILKDARAGNWKSARFHYDEILEKRAWDFQGTAGYASMDELKNDLGAIKDAFCLRRVDMLGMALESLADSAGAALREAEEEDPGEEGGDWSCPS